MTESSFGRLIAVLVSPKATFEAIDRRPTWVPPLVVILLLTVGLSLAIHARTDYREVIEQALAAKGVDASGGQIEQAVEFQNRFGAVTAVGGSLAATAFLVLVALVYLVGLHLLGSGIDFRRCLGVYLHACMPYALMTVLAIPLVLSGGNLSFEQLTVRSFVASNLAFLAPADAGIAAKSALAGIDFFAVWSLVLLALGFQQVGRVSRGAAWGLALVVWLLGLGVRVGLALLGAGGGG